jgi:hypothetical protein
MGDRTVYTTDNGEEFAELPTMPEAELRSAQVADGPPGMVGSSSDISIEAAVLELAIDADSKTVVDFETGLRTRVAVPAEERVID